MGALIQEGLTTFFVDFLIEQRAKRQGFLIRDFYWTKG